MSFSAETKKEICESITGKKCCALAACYGILLYCNTFSAREIRIITGNPAFAQILPRLFKRAFGFGFDSISEKTGTRGKQSFIINDKEKLSAVFDAYGYDIDSLLVHHVNLGVLDEDCCKVSFVKGAFLAGGSVTDPAKRYHFELVTAHHSVSRETYSLLLELGFLPRESSRKGNYIVYFKQSEVIEDVLTLLGASNASMQIMSAKIEKDMMNSVNRQVNCDTANVKKTVMASQAQLEAISKLEEASVLSTLPDIMQYTAKLRADNPELSISELAALHIPPITKSCLNHRLRKLTEMAGKL